jgi:hypothetical protein
MHVGIDERRRDKPSSKIDFMVSRALHCARRHRCRRS